MTREEVERRVLALLSGYVREGVEPRAETDILADTGMESVAVMDFVLEIEEAFDITIPLDRLTDVRTAGDIVAEVHGLVGDGAPQHAARQ